MRRQELEFVKKRLEMLAVMSLTMALSFGVNAYFCYSAMQDSKNPAVSAGHKRDLVRHFTKECSLNSFYGASEVLTERCAERKADESSAKEYEDKAESGLISSLFSLLAVNWARNEWNIRREVKRELGKLGM